MIKDIEEKIDKIFKFTPVYKIKKIEHMAKSLIKLKEEVHEYSNFFEKWKQNELNKNRFLKNKIIRQIFLERCFPIVAFENDTNIYPSIFAFIVRFFSNWKFFYTDKWTQSFEPFKKLLKLENSMPTYKKLNQEIYSIPGYPNSASAIIFGIDKKTKFSDMDVIYSILDSFKVQDEKGNLTKIMKTTSVGLIKYIISELLGNIQEHVANEDSKSNIIYLAEMGTYWDNDFIYISFSDAGITIPKKIKKFFKKNNLKSNINDSELLEWAFQEYKTTKTNSNGGRGLFDIKIIIKKLLAEMIVISNKSICIINESQENYYDDKFALNGTMFLLKIKQSALLEKEKIIFKHSNQKIKGVFIND